MLHAPVSTLPAHPVPQAAPSYPALQSTAVPSHRMTPPGGQRRCGCGGVVGPDGECATCKARRTRSGSDAPAAAPATAPPIVGKVLQERGQPLDPATRAFMAARFGQTAPVISMATTAPHLAAKLKVRQAGDKYEQEADRVAAQVVSTPPSQLQRRCACGGVVGPDGECATCRQKRLVHQLQRSATTGANTPADALPMVEQTLQSPGLPLDRSTRTWMESRFGADFAAVRVHTNEQAAASAQIMNAAAYTVGRDIVFGAGQYAPDTRDGQHLLAHELVHTLQQAEGPLAIARQPASPPTSPPASPPAPPAYGPACSSGATDPCQIARCQSGQLTTIDVDFGRGIQYVNAAIAALNASPRTSQTTRAMDWYFNDHSDATATTARTRLECIRDCLSESRSNQRYGCHPDHDALAYVCMGSTPACSQVLTSVCLTSGHFDTDPRTRAQTVIHECAHRVGMSLGAPASVPDIYRFTTRFLYLDTNEALLNADSYALFAGAISEGVPLTLLFPVIGASGGAALTGQGALTWQARFYFGAELQHPVLSIFNPTLGLGLSLIGVPDSPGAPPPQPSQTTLVSLLAGVRLADPRPGASGGLYLSLFGGPSLAVGSDVRSEVRVGAEAGVGVGYRWRWLDLSLSGGYAYDPTRQAGMRDIYTGSLGLTFIP